MYTTTITKSNQITLTKPAREALGVKAGEKIIVETKDDAIVLRRRPTDEELFEKFSSIQNKKTKAIVKSGKYANITNFRDLPTYRKEILSEYGH